MERFLSFSFLFSRFFSSIISWVFSWPLSPWVQYSWSRPNKNRKYLVKLLSMYMHKFVFSLLSK
jgi:hypothetical protein